MKDNNIMGVTENKTSGKAGWLHAASIRHRAALGKQHFCIKCGGRHQAPHVDLEALWRRSLMEIIALRGAGEAGKVTAYICS